MTLDTYHTTLGGEVEEGLLKLLVLVVHHEADVHQRTVFCLYCATEELVAVDLAIDDVGTLLSTLCHCLYTAVLLDPTEILEHTVDGDNGRCVEHRTLLDVGAIVEHGGNLAGSLAKSVVLDDDEGDSCHREVLLGTAVDAVVLAHVNGTAHDVGRHVGNDGHVDIKILADFSTVDGVVGGDVQIIDIIGACPSLGDEGVVGVGG